MKGISVIMPCYNEETSWVIKSIESIINQDYEQFELVIILDNPDNLILETLLKRYELDNSNITFIKNNINKGLSETLNIGISNSKYDYIARIDSDDFADLRRLTIQMEYLLENSLDIVGSNVYFIDEHDNVVSKSDVVINSKYIKKILPYKDVVYHPTWLMKREVFEKVGGYYNYKISEDYDFLLRAMSLNYKIGNCRDYLLYYRVRSSGITSSRRLEMLYTDGHIKKMHNKFKRNGDIYPKKMVINFQKSYDSNREFYNNVSKLKTETFFLKKMSLSLYLLLASKDFRKWLLSSLRGHLILSIYKKREML